MAEARFLLRSGDDGYARRRGEYPPPPVPTATRVKPVRKGGSKGRPQPQSHPWRGKNALLFATSARSIS